MGLRRPLSIRALAALGVLVLYGIALELYLRRFNPLSAVAVSDQMVQLSENPRLRYELSPTYPGHSAQGLRDRAFPKVKPPGRFRIAAIGDSTTYGLGVLPAAAPWPKRLEARLRAGVRSSSARAPFEVLNFGVPGYSIREEVEVLESRALAYHPDLVVLILTLNDWDDDSKDVRDLLEVAARHDDRFLADLYDPRAKAFSRVALHFQTYRWARHLWEHVTPAVTYAPPALEEVVSGRPFFDASFREFLTCASAHALPVVVGLLPFRRADHLALFEARLAHLRDTCATEGCVVVDFLGEAPESSVVSDPIVTLAPFFLADRLHLSERGSDRLAELVLRAARTNGILGRPN